MALLLTVCSGAWAADYTAPATKKYGNITFLNVDGTDANVTVGDNQYLTYGALYVATTLSVTTWYNSSDGKPADNKESGVIGDFSSQGFIKVTETTQNAVNGNGGLKSHGTRQRYYYVTGATSVAGLVKDNGSSKYTQLQIQEVAEDGTLGEATTIDGDKSTSQYVINGGALDRSKYYKITFTSNNTSNCAVYQIRFGKYSAPAVTYSVAWANGGHGTAPTSPTEASSIELPTMEADDVWTNTGWTADQTVTVAGEEKATGTFLAVGTTVTLTGNTTFTGVWQQASSFALTSAVEVEVKTTSQIATSGAAGTVTYESADASIATVSASGLITAVAPGKTTITVTDPGSAEVAGRSATVTVLVPYEAVAADSYVFKIGNYKFANNDNTKYYFDNGFTMTLSSAAACQYAALESNTGIKYSHARQYTINVPDNVAVTYAVIKARNNYKNENDNPAANWGTVFGTNYSSETLPWSTEDAVEKDFVVETPAAGADLTFQPGGNQWQAIITLYTTEYHAKYTVSFDAGEGTGSMDDVEVRGGSVYTLPGSTFTAPEQKGFDGWLCSVDGLVYAAGAEYTMTDANTTFTAQYAGVEGKALVKVQITGGSSATVTGTVGGTADVKVQAGSPIDGGYKFGSNGQYVGITLASGYTFKTGDIINVHITNAAQQGSIQIYSDKEGSTSLYNTEEVGVVGDNKFVLPVAVNGKSTIYICRVKDANTWNAYVDYIEVYRPGDNVVTLNSKGFATYSYNKDFAIYGATAYAMALDIDAGTLTGTAVEKVPAGAGILLKGEAGASVQILETTGAAALTGNNLKGTTDANGNTVDMPAGKTVYVLSGDTFKKYTGTELAANKAFFQVDGTTVEGRSFVMVFDGETTGIDALLIDNGQLTIDNAVYNLNGQRVMNPAKGLYIVNGRKVVIK